MYDANIAELKETLGNPKFKKYYLINKNVKAFIETLNVSIYEKKLPSLKIRKNEIVNDLIWKSYNS